MEFNNEYFYETKYFGYYVSMNGSVYSSKSNKILKGKKDKDGYVEYCLYVDGKQIYKRGHRIVAETFIPNPFNKEQVNHKNKIRDDNRIENLEFVTCSENNYHRCEGLEDKRKIKVLLYENDTLRNEYESLSEAKKHISGRYLSLIANDDKKYSYYFFERKDNGTVNVYWNGDILYTFGSVKETAIFFNKKPNTISQKIHKPTKTQKISKKYKILMVKSNDYRNCA